MTLCFIILQLHATGVIWYTHIHTLFAFASFLFCTNRVLCAGHRSTQVFLTVSASLNARLTPRYRLLVQARSNGDANAADTSNVTVVVLPVCDMRVKSPV